MARFPQIRSEKSVFPSPEPGEVVQINPPSLQWVAEPGVERYRVRVESLPSEQVVAEGETVYNFFRFRDQLEPGDYRWNVYAGEDERGWSAFTVPADAWPFRVPTAKEVLAEYPTVDILVNNAGIAPRADAGDRILDEEKWDMFPDLFIWGTVIISCQERTGIFPKWISSYLDLRYCPRSSFWARY